MTWVKDPAEELDYELDWSTRLGEDTIASSEWSVPEGDDSLTVNRDTHTDTVTKVWLTGGDVRELPYQVTNRVTTAGGRTQSRLVLVAVTSDWVSLGDFRDSLANAGGAGSRTAAELPAGRLLTYLARAHTKVRGLLHRYTIPGPMDDAPDMLRGIVTDLAAYGATLEWNGSQPLEDRDPIVLRYTAALADLKALTTGQLVIDGVDADVPGEAGGEPEVYDQTPYLGIAEEWQADEDRIGGYARRGIVPGSHW